jgi:hypothetical protein
VWKEEFMKKGEDKSGNFREIVKRKGIVQRGIGKIRFCESAL